MKRFITAALLFLASIAAVAQNIEVTVPAVVAADEQFTVQFAVSGENVSSFEWPLASGNDEFEVLWGPSTSRSSSTSIINGKVEHKSTTTYSYLLMPRKTGRFTLPAATAKFKSKTVSSRAAAVEVVAEKQSASGTQNQQSVAPVTGTVSSDDIFLKLELSRRSAVVGEGLKATLKLYTRVDIGGLENVKLPSFEGFWKQETYAPQNLELVRENVDGQIYNAAVLREYSIIPQRAGDITVESSEMVCLVYVRSQQTSGSIFDSFFDSGYKTVRKRVSTPETVIHVSPLPQPQPADFCGGVGEFRMTARLTADSVKTHDAASLRIRISGKGNVALLEAPAVAFPPDFEAYDVKTTDGDGYKEFEYPFIPRSHGDFTVGPITCSYYSSSDGCYKTLSSAALPLKVIKGQVSASGEGAQQIAAPSIDRRDVRNLATDIRHIAVGAPSFRLQGEYLLGSTLFWALLAAMFALAAAAYVLAGRIAARRSDVAGSRRRGASKQARRRLARAGDYLHKNLYGAFYQELHRALLGFASDKLGLDASELNKETISENLASAGAAQVDADAFADLIAACEYARYSPSAGGEAMNEHYEKAVELISALDDSLRRASSRVASKSATALLALALVVSAESRAADNSELWIAGCDAYTAGQWSAAADAFGQIAGSGYVSAELYYNLGNVCFRQEDYAHAVLWYERAVKLDPSLSDARFNLDYVQNFLQDRIETVPEFFLAAFLHKLGYAFSSDVWTVVFLVLLALALALALVYLRSASSGLRKFGFFGAIAVLLLSFCALGFASSQKKNGLSADRAVVMAAVSPVRSSPGASGAADLFVLHEGTVVRILDTVGDWSNVELADGRQGWILKKDFEII